MQQVVDTGRPGLARDARPGRRLGHGARAAGRDRGRPRSAPSRTSASSRSSRRRRTSRSGTGTSGGTSFAGRPPAGAAARSSRARPCPDIGGMMSALGTIGNSPSSSGGRAAGSGAAARAAAAAAPGAASSVDPEHGAAGVEALDDRRPRARGSPGLRAHPELLRLPRHALRGQRTAPVLLVAEAARDCIRCRVVEEGASTPRYRAPSPSKANASTAARISLPDPRPW